ncbi:fumarylacetoacetate hydrolase family protein [Ramlibacter sp. AW1]|uniref:Fumarylacetoacetate hydrolase family protein n=1 Tax=Ramlibacter aurantiacus TaxID=2801330 RepID=A0A936ZEW2_9BURK|nr:fumarylacetoacetate hydrolase family protein [Ramlibacter aurantiacus]MBL0419652.1 fumarylacetoacetate hydrolase family protein [Ramlibacter aurantiacus]
MKLASFTIDNRPAWGLVTDTGVIDLSRPEVPDLKTALELGVHESLAREASGRPDTAPLATAHFLPVIPRPDKIVCIGHNYEEHRVETRRDKTANPSVFLRVASSQVGHAGPLVMPAESTQLDYEGEIALVIGKPGRRIPEASAWQHIAGYSAYNDASVRDWQYHTAQFTPGKNFAGTGAFGPWMVTRGDIADGEVLTLETRLNGQVMQRADTSQLIFPIPRLIAYLSTFLPLAPGDVIVTGTPGGVGAKRNPPVWMKPGDVVEVEVSQVGVLRNVVRAEL